MSAGRTSRALGVSPDYYAETPGTALQREMSARIAGHRKSIVVGVWNIKVPKSADFPPVRFICRLRNKVSRAVRLISVHRVTPRSCSVNQCRPLHSSQVDLHRSEAIDDCIEFFNSCGSLQRSNSVS
ncbi:hypothetical protein H6P81_006794 [Aristolochia fimbriata]|uniref:Uncharacterized protein n=1 Tax=Aristolochia fimbriata TaxID=158543 RepID=A0AAV7EYA6_ARIFI|nr:hypothetical protein H6P81_006794 [Aristolochia fimbriata]